MAAAVAVAVGSIRRARRRRRRVAFGAFLASNREADIWSTRPGEDDLHQLIDAPGHDICPAYSADGKDIAFCSARTGAYEIWVMDANGEHERQVTQLGTYAVFPDFSPDGSRLAFSATAPGQANTDLWLAPTSRGHRPSKRTPRTPWRRTPSGRLTAPGFWWIDPPTRPGPEPQGCYPIRSVRPRSPTASVAAATSHATSTSNGWSGS